MITGPRRWPLAVIEPVVVNSSFPLIRSTKVFNSIFWRRFPKATGSCPTPFRGSPGEPLTKDLRIEIPYCASTTCGSAKKRRAKMGAKFAHM